MDRGFFVGELSADVAGDVHWHGLNLPDFPAVIADGSV